MSDRPVSIILSALHTVTGFKPRRNGSGWNARCPAHDDHQPSVSISEGDDGRVLVYCHRGCAVEAIVSALGLKMADLMPAGGTDADKKRRCEQRAGISSAFEVSRRVRTFPTARAAIAELEQKHGSRSDLRTYHNADGEPVGVVVRWDRPGGGKDIRPVSRTSKGWIIGAMPTPRPLYRLPELAEAQRVYVCEGEKAADAVRALGLTATTSAGGANAAAKTEWEPLAGREVVILPDYDDAGTRYADGGTGLLSRLTPTPVVKLVELPERRDPGDDAEQFIAARRAAGLDDDAIRTELEHLADAAEPIQLERPAPVIERYCPFPVEVLPEPVLSFVAKSAQAMGCDPSYVALPMLSALAAAIGNTRYIQLKRGWTEPAIIWTAIVGESGTLKTPAFKLVMRPTLDRQRDALRRHAEEQAEHEAKVLRYDAELTAWKRAAAKGDGKAGDPPEKPTPPQPVRYIVSDTTVEALAPILLANPRGLLLARDELAGWIRGFDAYKAGRGGDMQAWESMHSAEVLVVDRKTTGLIYVPCAAVSVCGGIQPGVLQRAMGRLERDSGLLARLLLATPPRRSKRWTETETPASAEAAVRAIVDRLFTLEPDHDDNGDPRPRIVTLTPEARRVWIAFYNEHAKEQIELTGDLSAAWSKLEGYAARLALEVHLVRWAAGDPALVDPDRVDEVSIGAGVALSRWFGREARRVYSVLAESDDDRDRRLLVELIERKGESVSVRDWQRARSHKTAGDAEAELNELVEAGYGRWHVPRQAGRGRPTKRFVLATDSTDTDKNAADGLETGIVSVSEASDGADDDCEADGAADEGWGEI